MSSKVETTQARFEDAAKQMMPKFDFDTVVAMQRANLETFAAAQKVMFDLAQTMARRHADLFKESMARFETLMKGFDGKRQPQSYVDEMKDAVEKAMAEVKESVDLGIRAQSEVVDLLVKRASANLEEVKSLAA